MPPLISSDTPGGLGDSPPHPPPQGTAAPGPSQGRPRLQPSHGAAAAAGTVPLSPAAAFPPPAGATSPELRRDRPGLLALQAHHRRLKPEPDWKRLLRPAEALLLLFSL